MEESGHRSLKQGRRHLGFAPHQCKLCLHRLRLVVTVQGRRRPQPGIRPRERIIHPRLSPCCARRQAWKGIRALVPSIRTLYHQDRMAVRCPQCHSQNQWPGWDLWLGRVPFSCQLFPRHQRGTPRSKSLLPRGKPRHRGLVQTAQLREDYPHPNLLLTQARSRTRRQQVRLRTEC